MSVDLDTKVLWKNRIVGHEEVDPETLYMHPNNWRIERPTQRGALQDSMNKLHFVKSVLVNKRTGRIIDGHKRVKLARDMGQATVPVEYVDLSEEEEALALAVLDSITEMSGVSPRDLNALLAQVEVEQEFGSLLGLLNNLAKKADLTDNLELVFDAPPPRHESGYESHDYENGEGGPDHPGAVPYEPAPAEPSNSAASHIKMLQLFLTVQTHGQLMEWVTDLAEIFSTDNTTDTVWKAVEHAHKDLISDSD